MNKYNPIIQCIIINKLNIDFYIFNYPTFQTTLDGSWLIMDKVIIRKKGLDIISGDEPFNLGFILKEPSNKGDENKFKKYEKMIFKCWPDYDCKWLKQYDMYTTNILKLFSIKED